MDAATELQEMILIGRRRKNESEAQRIFGSKRRLSKPSSPRPLSLASRISKPGLTKKRSSLGPRRPRNDYDSDNYDDSDGNVNGEWTHDKHASVSDVSRRGGRKTRADGNQARVVATSAKPHGLSIRGIAGPFTVIAKNFAPGTSLADIQQAMVRDDYEMRSCEMISTKPPVTCKMVFEYLKHAQDVIERFHKQSADGRTLEVYHDDNKPSPLPSDDDSRPPRNAPSGPRAERGNRRNGNNQVIDGSMGFESDHQRDNRDSSRYTQTDRRDHREAANSRGSRRANDDDVDEDYEMRDTDNDNRDLYSDDLVASNCSRRGFGGFGGFSDRNNRSYGGR